MLLLAPCKGIVKIVLAQKLFLKFCCLLAQQLPCHMSSDIEDLSTADIERENQQQSEVLTSVDKSIDAHFLVVH